MRKNMKKSALLMSAVFIVSGIAASVWAEESGAPSVIVEPPYQMRDGSIRNQLSFDQMHGFTTGTTKGLNLDLGDPGIQGKIHTGPYPFEAGESDYDYPRYRRTEALVNGAGLLRMDKFIDEDKYNANEWPAGQGANPPSMMIGYRLEVDGDGYYDSVLAITRDGGNVFGKNLSIVEGPFLTMATSDDPTKATIAFELDEALVSGTAKVQVDGIGDFTSSDTGKKHEVEVTGLTPSREYQYRVVVEDSPLEVHTAYYKFRAAPAKDTRKPVRFGFISDSREGVGGGERVYTGHNKHQLDQLVKHAYRKGADLFIFGGDLVNGYTSEIDDFRLQLKGWKQTFAGFWRGRPVYPAMGNHETLLNVYDDGGTYGISLDKWPYATDSAEAVFADEFYNPVNGPVPSNPDRPTYNENVYKFQQGPVLFIAFNNNYWWTTNSQCENYGGSPEGYMLDDQLAWIENVLVDAEDDEAIKYIILYAQEPVFPAGGHVKDAMWYNGNNNVKAYVNNGGTVEPAGPGIVDTRNHFWETVSGSSKVAAVLTGDEHAYHRIRIDSAMPVGMPDVPSDDSDGDGIVCEAGETCSPNPAFTYPTWQVTAGTGGAPYYALQDMPWRDNVVAFSSQTGYCMFEAKRNRISMTVYTITGQKIDYVRDLMAIK